MSLRVRDLRAHAINGHVFFGEVRVQARAHLQDRIARWAGRSCTPSFGFDTTPICCRVITPTHWPRRVRGARRRAERRIANAGACR